MTAGANSREIIDTGNFNVLPPFERSIEAVTGENTNASLDLARVCE
jgi:hypothetical protein